MNKLQGNLLNNIISKASTGIQNDTFKDYEERKILMKKLELLIRFAPYWIPTVLLILLYVYYFHSKRIRWFNTAIMIKLEPENRDYCTKMANFLYNYYHCEHFKLDYTKEIENNLYFYTNTYSTDMTNIRDQVLKNTVFEREVFYKDIKEEIETNLHFEDNKVENFKEQYIEGIEKLFNTDFRWSHADKFKRNSKNKEVFETLFGKNKKEKTKKCERDPDFKSLLDILTEDNKHTSFNQDMKDKSIFNFVDLDNIDDMDSILTNALFVKYCKYLSKSLRNMIIEVNDDLKQKNPNVYRKTDNDVNIFLSDNNDHPLLNESEFPNPISDLFDELLKELKEVYFTYYGIDEEFYAQFNNDGNTQIQIKKKKCSQKDKPLEKEFLDDKEQNLFNQRMEFLRKIENMKHEYPSKSDKTEYLLNTYFKIEEVVYTSFDPEDHTNIFSQMKIAIIIALYQNIIDMSYLDTKLDQITIACQFTIYHILSPDSYKDQKLNSLLDLYVNTNDMYLVNKFYKSTLLDYNNKRNPNMSCMKALYIKNYEMIYKYYLYDGITKPFLQFFRKKRPTRYSWIFSGFVDSIAKIPNKQIIDMVMSKNKENFETHDESKPKFEPHKEIEVEPFFGGIGKIFNVFKKVPEFLSKFIKLLGNILNPMKLVEVIVKFLLVILLLFLKNCLFSMKIGEIYFFGEHLIYLFALPAFATVNFGFFCFFGVLNSVAFFLDIVLTKGLFYKFMYWLVGAAENAPSSWYKRSGYHYGFHLCKPTDDEDTRCTNNDEVDEETNEKKKEKNECNNYYQNKVKRMFLAYYNCGENYKPDKQTRGFACVRKYLQEPAYCMQANIYRIKEGLSAKLPHVPGRFIPTPEYFNASRRNRIKLENDFKNMKLNYYTNCGTMMGKYDDITKNICRIYSGIIDGNKRHMDNLCYNAYCVNGSREPFCYKFTQNIANPKQNNSLIRRMAVVVLYVLILAYIINMLFTNKVFEPVVASST